ncbi:hypothetical protein Gotur_027671 [Gossypium turneri]
MRPKARRSQWSASCVMVCIGCGSVRRSLSSMGTMEQTMSPRSLVRAREKSKPRGQRGAKRSEQSASCAVVRMSYGTVQSKPESKER